MPSPANVEIPAITSAATDGSGLSRPFWARRNDAIAMISPIGPAKNDTKIATRAIGSNARLSGDWADPLRRGTGRGAGPARRAVSLRRGVAVWYGDGMAYGVVLGVSGIDIVYGVVIPGYCPTGEEPVELDPTDRCGAEGADGRAGGGGGAA